MTILKTFKRKISNCITRIKEIIVRNWANDSWIIRYWSYFRWKCSREIIKENGGTVLKMEIYIQDAEENNVR